MSIICLWESFALANDSIAGVYSSEMPPLACYSDGHNNGIAVDLFLTVMDRAGMPYEREAIKIVPFVRAMDAARHSKSIVLGMARTKPRIEQFKWVGPVYFYQFGLIGKKDKKFDLKTLDDAAKLRVVGVRDIAPSKMALKMGFPEDRLTQVGETKFALRMIKGDRMDLFVHTANVSFTLMPSLGLDPHNYKVHYVLKDRIPIYFGMNKGFSDEFVAKLQTALDGLKESASGISEYDQIVDRHVPEKFF